MIITAIPTNLFLILYTLFIGFTSSSLFAFAAVTKTDFSQRIHLYSGRR